MREISSDLIRDTVALLCRKANRELSPDIALSLASARDKEQSPACRAALGMICDNLSCAAQSGLAVCQDTGMAVVFAEIGQDVHIIGSFEDAVHAGVAKGYTEGYLRASVVSDPLRRTNTGDNTPAVIHTRLVPGDRIRITVEPKGFGSENMSAMRMFTPAATAEDIIDFVKDVARNAGSNPCPPMILGVGIGGTMEKAALMAKHALTRPLDRENPDSFYAALEKRMLAAVNSCGIGAQGFGGTETALAVLIESYPTHIAGLPVAVNMGCYVTRHAEAEI
ncbi:MAG: fumarate hydratase [Clostridia bacterium]|nr:fumarate hydratase [Clostridia bacterium]